MRPFAVLCSFLAACSFVPGGDPAAVDAPPGDDPDALAEDIHHLAPADERTGDVDLRIDQNTLIDTGTLEVAEGALPDATFIMVAQDGGGPDLAVLRVRDLVIADGARLRAVGTRPLVILARAVLIEGELDVGGHDRRPGAGALGTGPSVGGNGARAGSYFDSGGGGGGFAVDGAPGGNGGGGGGLLYGDDLLALLQGGSGGGSAAGEGGCPHDPGGGGGGAVQIYARQQIVVAAGGGINAGGGGGGAGRGCTFQYTAGRGGGSGGAIYLQAPAIDRAGVVAANGGGGGGGASENDGGRGTDGGLNDSPAAGGGSGGSNYGSAGGDGGAGTTGPTAGGDHGGNGNGGGGGGSVGRIVIRTRVPRGDGLTSPPALIAPY